MAVDPLLRRADAELEHAERQFRGIKHLIQQGKCNNGDTLSRQPTTCCNVRGSESSGCSAIAVPSESYIRTDK
jgi:hypothetical protein